MTGAGKARMAAAIRLGMGRPKRLVALRQLQTGNETALLFGVRRLLRDW